MTRAARAKAPAVVPAPRLEQTLSNGLRVVCVPREGLHRAVVHMVLRAGSRFETRANNGVSHFLEHMLYRGCPSHATAHDQALAFERLGGTLMAATYVDHGAMTLALPPESLVPAAKLFAEVAQHPRLSDIETERGIVREEILEDLDEQGRQVDADNLAREVMYGEHPLGFTITGGAAQLDRFDRRVLLRHHARHYAGRNAVLVFAGAIDPDACFRLARREFAGLPAGLSVRAVAPPTGQSAPRFRFVHNLSSQTDLRVAFRAPGEHDAREPAVDMLLRVLDDGMSTRLYERICDRKGLCYDVSGMYECYDDEGVFDVAAEAQHARAGQVLGEVLAILAELAAHGPTDAELDKAKLRHGWQLRAMLDDAEALAGFHGLATLSGRFATPEARHARMLDVACEEVRAAAEAIFRPDGLSVVAVGAPTAAQQRALEKATASFGA